MTEKTLSLLERGLNQVSDSVSALLVEARPESRALTPQDTPMAERYLFDQSWPGNLRELRHAIERACILFQQEMIGPNELRATDTKEAWSNSSDGRDLKGCLQACEENFIREALEAHRWHIAETADSLKISRKNLWEKMRKHGIDKEKNSGN